MYWHSVLFILVNYRFIDNSNFFVRNVFFFIVKKVFHILNLWTNLLSFLSPLFNYFSQCHVRIYMVILWHVFKANCFCINLYQIFSSNISCLLPKYVFQFLWNSHKIIWNLYNSSICEIEFQKRYRIDSSNTNNILVCRAL